MKTYTKTHSSKKVAEIHLDKIKKRGGKAGMKPVKGGFQIEYSFPEKKEKKDIKQTKKKRYDILSPDGFSIRIGVEPFKTREEGVKYFEKWKKRFEKQGYYSSNTGRIELEDLEDYCEFVDVEFNQ
ncbi:MAG: hypothetical protein HY062_06000 [Bacteroidetes bacterium]|nr:hypothetical protein [Bacteroidota bacterium]